MVIFKFFRLKKKIKSTAERAPVAEVVRPVPARELVQPRDVGDRRGTKAQPARGRQNEPVAGTARRDKVSGLGAARRRHRRAVAVAAQVGGQSVAVGAVICGGEAVDGAFDVIDEGGAVSLGDLHGKADAVGGGA